MGRPREFDEEVALRNAMQVFWAKGFGATSLSDLTDAMGISRSSLYAAFGDKDAVFARAMDLYVGEVSAERVRILRDAKTAREGLRDFFEHHIRVALDPRTPAGCFVVNTALEIEGVAEPTAKLLTTRSRRGETAVRDLIERGQASGEIATARDARALAAMLVALSYGIHVMARMGTDRATLNALVDAALAAVF